MRGRVTSDDYATIKYDTNGNLLWVIRYNGPGNGIDRSSDLVVDSAGNVYVTGYSEGQVLPTTMRQLNTIPTAICFG